MRKMLWILMTRSCCFPEMRLLFPLGPACWLQLSSLCSWPDTSSVTYKSIFDNSLFSLEHTAPQFHWPKPYTLFPGFLTVQPTVETWSVMQANLILASLAAPPVIKSSQTQMATIKQDVKGGSASRGPATPCWWCIDQDVLDVLLSQIFLIGNNYLAPKDAQVGVV